MAGKKDDVEVIGAFPPPELGSSVKKIPFWKKPAFVKGAAAGVLLGGIVIFFVHFKKNSIPHTTSVVSAPPLPENAGGVSKNPEYRRKIAQLNRERTLNASRNGQSVVPTLGGDDKAGEISAGEAKTSSSPDVSPRRDSRKSRKQRVKLRAYEASRTAEVASVDKEISGILATWSGAGDGLAVLSPPKSSIRSGREISSGVKRTSEAAGLPKKKIPVIPAGKILYGRIVNELNSDHPGPVLAQAVGGKWDGVKFLGSFQRDHGALVIKFDRVIYPDGETDSIGAYAVSPGTRLRSGLETDVNHHYLYRYGALLASAFLEGFGESAMYSNSTSYPSTFGTPVIGFNGMTLLQQSEMGLGQAGMMLSGNAMNAFNRPTTVKVAANTPVGLLIVAETGQKLPKESSPTGQNSAKPGLVNAPVPSMVPQPGYPAMPMMGGYPGYGGGYGMPMMPMMP